jgi:hypothetical protein
MRMRRRTCPNRDSRYCHCLMSEDTSVSLFRQVIGTSYTGLEIDHYQTVVKHAMMEGS